MLRAHSPAPSVRELLGRLAYQVYVTVVCTGLWVVAFIRTLSAPSTGATQLSDTFGQYVPAGVTGLAFLLTTVGIRAGSWAGPVLVSRPDTALLLPAPLDRRLLLRRHLGGGLAAFGATGALVGASLGAVVAVEARTSVVGPLVGTPLVWGGLGVLTGAVALRVESSWRLARAALRGTPVFVAVGALLVWATAAEPAIAAWATPWGWAATPIMVAAGHEVAFAWLPPALGVAVAGIATAAASRQLPNVPDEELIRRAGTSSGVRASAAMFDARAIAQARRSGQQRLVGTRRVSVRRPHQRAVLIVWRDLVSLVRRPGAVERTVTVIAAAAALVVWGEAGGAVIVAAVLLVSLTAGQLLEPLRVELEEPVIEELTPLTAHDVALEHLIVPIGALGASGTVAIIALATAGLLPWTAIPAALVGVVAAAALLGTAAGLAATRGAPPLHWLVSSEYGVMALAAWVVAGPLLALVLTVPLAMLTVQRILEGHPPVLAVSLPAVMALGVSGVLAGLVRWRV